MPQIKATPRPRRGHCGSRRPFLTLALSAVSYSRKERRRTRNRNVKEKEERVRRELKDLLCIFLLAGFAVRTRRERMSSLNVSGLITDGSLCAVGLLGFSPSLST